MEVVVVGGYSQGSRPDGYREVDSASLITVLFFLGRKKSRKSEGAEGSSTARLQGAESASAEGICGVTGSEGASPAGHFLLPEIQPRICNRRQRPDRDGEEFSGYEKESNLFI